MSVDQVRKNLLSSNILNLDEIEKLQCFWNGNAYIKCGYVPNGKEYIYVIGDQFYGDGITLYLNGIESVERVIVSALMSQNVKIIKTKAGKRIRNILDGTKYTFKDVLIKYLDSDLFELDLDDEYYDLGDLFYLFMMHKDCEVKKIEE